MFEGRVVPSKVSIVAITLSLAMTHGARAQEGYWQCAAFARSFSGIEIRGDAVNWWQLAEGRYARGGQPRVGAVLALKPQGRMTLGHVATVTRILSRREIAVTHANWSPIDGVRGQVERDVLVRDVSEAGDWSRVRIWFAPIGELGTTHYAVQGFVYPQRLDGAESQSPPAPRLTYARLDTLEVAPHRLLARDVMRLALLEARQPQDPHP